MLGLAKPGPRVRPVLEYAEARRLLAIVRARPGIGPAELGRAFGKGVGGMYHHLDRLVAAGHVRKEQDPREKRAVHLFASDAASEETDEIALTRLLNETGREIALLLAMNPHTSVKELQRLSGWPLRTVYKHVEDLVEKGLAKRNGDRGYAGLRPTSRLYTLLALPEPGKPRRA